MAGVVIDVVIIGAGHNALVTAFYLARAGHKPLVLERRDEIGGAAITSEFHPGFRCSTLAHTAGPLQSAIARDMDLERHGLKMIHPPVRVFAPTTDGRALLLLDDVGRSAESIAAFSEKDAARYAEFSAVLNGLGGILGQLVQMTPPDLDDPNSADFWNLLKTFKDFRGLSREDRFRLLRWSPMAVADLAGEWFESEPLRAVIAARGIFDQFAGPWSAGTGAAFLLRVAADPHPAGPSCSYQGGMGALSRALAAAAKAAGAEIRTGAEVVSIISADGVVTGVVLAGGEEIPARAVISGADPRRTFLGLVDPVELPTSFIFRMQSYLGRGVTAKVNLALAKLPEFTALKGAKTDSKIDTHEALAGRIHIGPEIDYLERAFDDAKYGSLSQRPYLDITIPSVADPSLAPAGQHVMSVHVQYAPYDLKEGDWAGLRDTLAARVIETISEYAPGFAGSVIARQVITPADLETTYGYTSGDIGHGELTLDQIFTMRPMLGWARYRSPLAGLYLCGSGTHPGNGLTGSSGANAAREILRDLRR